MADRVTTMRPRKKEDAAQIERSDSEKQLPVLAPERACEKSENGRDREDGRSETPVNKRKDFKGNTVREGEDCQGEERGRDDGHMLRNAGERRLAYHSID